MANKSEQIKSQVGIEIRGNSIRIIFYFQGKMCRETVVTGTSKADINYAVRRRAEILRKIEDNEFNYCVEFPNSKQAKKFTPQRPTCYELFNQLISRYENSNKKPITKITYIRIIRNKLIPYFGDYFIDEVNSEIIKEFIFSLTNTAKYINQLILQIRAMLDYALNDRLIKEHPLEQLALNKLIDEVATDSNYEINPFTEEEQNLILQSCDNKLIKNFIALAFNTGMRLGELIALRWQDIKNSYIEVKLNMVKGYLSTPKTKSGQRKILLLPKAKSALIELRGITGHSEFVFINPDTKLPWQSSDAFWKQWNKVIKKSGIQYRPPYQCRHTYASMLVSKGENLSWVATQMGHVDIEMITRIYAKWIPQADNELGYELKGKY